MKKISVWPINTNSQDQCEINHPPNTTIQTIIELLSKQFSIPAQQIRLIAYGNILQPSATLSQIFPSTLGFISMIVCKPKVTPKTTEPVIAPTIAQPLYATSVGNNDAINQLTDMGFQRQVAEQALLLSKGNVEFAVSLLENDNLNLLAKALNVPTTSNQSTVLPNLSNQDKECIAKLKNMGFDEKKATIAYIAANKNFEMALEGLIQLDG